MKKIFYLIKKGIAEAVFFLISLIMLIAFEAIDKYVLKRDIQLFDHYYWINILVIVLGVVAAILLAERRAVLEDKDKYYIRTKGYIGNGLVWWRPNKAGYTSDLEKAGTYTYEQASQICKNTHGDNLAYKCSTIDNMEEGLILQVHSDYVPKPDIGTRFGEEIE